MIEPSLAISLFATPVVVIDLPDMAEVNAELARHLLAEEHTIPSWHRANVGAWHSEPDLSRQPHDGFRAVIRHVVAAVAGTVASLAGDAGILQLPQFRYAVTAWAMILRNGHYVTPHDHGDVHWSAAYYVDAGDDLPAPSGRLAFLDPRRSGCTIPGVALFPTAFEIAPRTSALAIFPGWLQHHVHAYRGERPRMCTSCNLAGFLFTGWSGACTGTGECTIDAAGSAGIDVAAMFSPAVTLSVTLAGDATGTVSSLPDGIACGSTRSAPFEPGTSVTLKAVPTGTPSSFVGWSSPMCPGTGDCTQVLTGETTAITATFTKHGSATFTTSGDFTVPPGVSTVHVLAVGGGDGGANGHQGGGGSGLVATGTLEVSGSAVVAVTVGDRR